MHGDGAPQGARRSLRSLSLIVRGVFIGALMALILSTPARAQTIDLDACIINPLCVVLEVEVPVVEVVEKVVEVPVEVIREVERIVEVPGPERIVEVEVPVPGPTEYVEVPGPERVVEVEVERVVIVEVDAEGEPVDPADEDLIEEANETTSESDEVVQSPPTVLDSTEDSTEPEQRTIVRRVLEELGSYPWWVYVLAVLAGIAALGVVWYYGREGSREQAADEDLELIRDINRKD